MPRVNSVFNNNPSLQGSTVPKDVSFDVSPAFNISGEDRKYLSPELLNQIDTFLADSQIPDARKKAFLSAYSGLSSSLPTESWLDKLSTSIIGTSNYQKAMNKYGTDVGALLGQYINTDYQEDYNSAESQQSRILQAGINPDIAGGVDAGSSTDFDDQSSFPVAPSEVLPDGQSIFMNVLQTISGVFGWVSSIQGMMRNGLELDSLSTSVANSDLDYIKNLAHSSDFIPESALAISPDVEYYNEELGKSISFADKDGNLIPYTKLSAEQKDTLRSMVGDYVSGRISSIYDDFYFRDSNFSENKKRRLRARLSDYLKSEDFRARWYESHSRYTSNRLSSVKDESDPMFNAFDSLLESFQSALVKSNYDSITNENVYNSKQYKALVDKGVPEDEASLRARAALRDEADHAIMDEIRTNLTNTLKDPKADKWSKILSRLGLLLLPILTRKGF